MLKTVQFDGKRECPATVEVRSKGGFITRDGVKTLVIPEVFVIHCSSPIPAHHLHEFQVRLVTPRLDGPEVS